MTQDEMEQMLQALGGVAVRQQHLNERMVTAIEHVTAAIERIDLTIQAIKDLLERGNGR